MNGKERVRRTLRGEPVDRLPRYLWIGAAVAPKLCEYYQIPPEALEGKVGNDVMQTWLSINREMERPAAEGERFTDEWGIVWERQGYYNMVIHHPMAELDAEEIRRYPVPGLLDGGRFDRFDRLLADYGQTHFIGADVSGTLFEPAYHLRGMENLLMDLASEAEEADAILDVVEAHSTRIAVEAARRGADWIWLGDDMGSQLDLLMSPDLWRHYFKPRMARIIEAVRTVKPDMPIAYHSCGAVRRILPDLLDLGLDVINPLQQSAAHMDHDENRRLFGDRATMVCGPDTQKFLLHATPQQVREEVRDLARRLGSRGRFLFGVSHTLQPDVPMENIAAA